MKVKVHLLSTGSSNQFPVSYRSFRTRINLKTNKYQDELLNTLFIREKMFQFLLLQRGVAQSWLRAPYGKRDMPLVSKKKKKKTPINCHSI